MTPVEPIHAAERFAPLHAELIALLSRLSDEEWLRPTAAPLWTVRDVAAHLLDGDVRQLSFRRDGMPPPPADRPIGGYRDFVAFLDHVNAVWVDAARRMSPRLLVELHAFTGPEVARLFEGLDPNGPALFPVAWAGEERSLNWMDTAREYTERWHHQQQIRDATGRAPLTGREWLHPVLDTFVRALPHTYHGRGGGRVVAAAGGGTLDAPLGDRPAPGGHGHDGRRRGLAALHQGTAARSGGGAGADRRGPAAGRAGAGCPRDHGVRRTAAEPRPGQALTPRPPLPILGSITFR
jgi:uncharacterized protein (TIGR03083 family)